MKGTSLGADLSKATCSRMDIVRQGSVSSQVQGSAQFGCEHIV